MTRLRVIESFDSLQGEGYWTGVPMTFVRLAGCNAPALSLGCVRWCDTPGSWALDGGEEHSVGGLLDRVRLPRLCLTGGEPLLQMEGVVELLEEAHRREIRVHVETNGTIGPATDAVWRPDGIASAGRGGAAGDELRFDWAVVSPKPLAYEIDPGWDGLVDELKLVVDETLDAVAAERLAAAHPEAFVSIQPAWGTGAEDAVALVMAHPEWRLSLQTHKYLGIR